jgi:FixJ family two-component response regulator
MPDTMPRLALVDDEESVRKAVGRLLRSGHMEVATFQSGASFLEAADDTPFDCLVLDLHMPEMSGFELIDRMSRNGIRTPVVVITGDDTPENRERVRAAGIAACLAKPVDAQLLFDAINAAIAA